jgi:signal transduction histidine kinase
MRSPLSAILGWCRVMTLDNAGADVHRRGLQAIERNAMAQVRLVDDLIDLTRIGSGKLELQRTTVLLADAVDAAVESCTPAAEAKGLVIDWRDDDVPVLVHGDKARLTQVVWNLVGNAIKFSPAGERIVVRVAQDGARARITVHDRGAGIAPELLPQIFEPFRQADDTPASRLGGLGLGLTIARTIVELHGGEIRAESDGPGQGAVFTVTLPVISAQAAQRDPASAGRHAAATAQGPGAAAGGRRLRRRSTAGERIAARMRSPRRPRCWKNSPTPSVTRCTTFARGSTRRCSSK